MTGSFLQSESGAVTVDWMVLTAGILGLGVAAAASVATGTTATADKIAKYMDQDFFALHRYGENRLANGSFEDIAGMREQKWGFYNQDGSLSGWINEGDARLEVQKSGQRRVMATDGSNMLDLDASPGNVRLGQVLDDAIQGVTYSISFDAADPQGNNGVEIYFGGELVAYVEPQNRPMEHYSFEIIGGAGDGDNLLTIGGTGPEDFHGVYIDNILVAN
jgi:hypothetical protein